MAYTEAMRNGSTPRLVGMVSKVDEKTVCTESARTPFGLQCREQAEGDPDHAVSDQVRGTSTEKAHGQSSLGQPGQCPCQLLRPDGGDAAAQTTGVDAEQEEHLIGAGNVDPGRHRGRGMLHALTILLSGHQ